MNKIFLLIVTLITMIMVMCSCGSSEPDNKKMDLSTKEGIQAYTESYFKEEASTDIDSVTVNDDAGKGSGYILLVNVVFTTKNKADTSKQMIQMLSEDFAAHIGEEASDVNEVSLMWEVPYLEGNAKVQYERTDGGMKLGDESFSF